MKRLGVVTLLLILCSLSSFSQDVNIKWVRNVSFKTIRPYSEGMAAYSERGKWGFIGESGDIVLYHKYDEVRDFYNEHSVVKEGGKYGVIDKSGKYVHECVFDTLSAFSDDVAFGVIDNKGYYVYLSGKTKELNAKYEYLSYSGGMIKIKSVKNGKVGYADKKGVLRIDTRYDAGTDFKNGKAAVLRKGKWYSINEKGDKSRVKTNFSQPHEMFDGGAGYIKVGDKYKVFNQSLKLCAEEYSEVSPISEGLIRVKDLSGNYKYLNGNGKVVLSLNGYEDCGSFREGKAWVKKGGKYGYIDDKGKLIIDASFSYAGDFGNGVAHVIKMDDKGGFIKIADKDEPFAKIKVVNITLADENKNNNVEVGEKFRIKVSLSNSGEEILIGAAVDLKLDTDVMGLNIETLHRKVGSIPPGGTRVVYFSGTTNANLPTTKVQVTFTMLADNVLTQTTVPFTFSVGN